MKRKNARYIALFLSLCTACSVFGGSIAMADEIDNNGASVTAVSSAQVADYETTGLQKDSDGNLVYVKSNGNLLTDSLKKIDGSIYYFDSEGHALKNEWKTVDGKHYYFSKNCEAVSGWKKIDGQRFYFNSNCTQYRKKGFKTIDGYKYYFDKDNGYAATIGWAKISGSKYYFTSSGKMKTGWATIDGHLYYFNKSGKMQTSKWVFNLDNRYYLKKNGQAATGWTKISGYRYYFNKKGVIDEDVRNRSDVSGPYRSVVSLTELSVTIIGTGEDGVQDIAVVKFACSPGKASTPTPTGTYTAYAEKRWEPLMGPSWGQYGTHVVDGIYYHSCATGQKNIYDMNQSLYDTLYYASSHGCIRLSVADAKWVFQHAGDGLETKITKSSSKKTVTNLQRTEPVPYNTYGENLNWDPTDPIALKEQMGKEKTGKPKAADGETLVKYTVQKDSNYRYAPSRAGAYKGVFKVGTTVYAVKGSKKSANGYTWFKIKVGNRYYYMISKYLKKK